MSDNRPPENGPDGRRLTIIHSLVRLGGEASPSEIAGETGIASRTLTRDLDALAQAGLMSGDKHRRRLTPEGYGAIAPSAVLAPAGSFDEAVREIFPAYHAAFVRLVADAVVIRSLNPGREWHPAFAASGSPGTGKSAMADFICRAFGLDVKDSVRMAPSLAPGELLGRRHQVPGGAHVFDQSSLVSAPFVCLDEWAQAGPLVRRESLRLLDGTPRVTVEETTVELRATVMIAYNPSKGPDPRPPLPDAYWRRCVVIHTDAAGPATRSLSGKLDEFYDPAGPAGPAAYDLGALVLPYGRLPADCRHLLVDEDRGMPGLLTDAGKLHYGNIRSLEALALGRIARYGLAEGDSPVAVLMAVAYDVLAVAETIPGHVVPGWQYAIDNVAQAIAVQHGEAPGAHDLRSAIAAGNAARAALDAQRADARQVKERDSLTLTRDRAAIVARFDGAARSIMNLPVEHRPAAAGLRAQLRKLSAYASESRSAEALAEVEQLGAGVLDEALALRRRIDDDKARVANERSQQDAKDRARKAERALADSAVQEQRRERAAREKAQAAKRKSAAKMVRKLLARTSTKAGEDVAGRLVAIGVVGAHDEAYRIDARTPWDELWRRPERWVIRHRRVFEGIDGKTYRPEQLASWQAPAVRQLLGVALDMLSQTPALGMSRARGELSPPPMPELQSGPALARPPSVHVYTGDNP